MEVAQWLESIGFSKYQELFEENGIDTEVLADLTNEDLKDIGITRLGDRKKILLAASALCESIEIHSEVETSPQLSASSPLREKPETSSITTGGAAENRQLSVMFCDLVGSTELSTKVDAEELREIINRFQHTCSNIAKKYGGFVARYSGDGILVYFGYPRANEDDPERAINCGLEITRNMPALDAEVRVGIATGRVIVGDLLGSGPAAERTVVGETPNLAARLQSLARANSVVISDTTQQLVGGVFEFRDLGKHPVKGFPHPISVLEVVGEKEVDSRFETKIRSDNNELIGRESELTLLLDKWQEATEAEGQMAFISGEAGIGKSRLIDALRLQASSVSPVTIRYQCSPHHTSSAFYPTIRQFYHATGIVQADDNGQKLDKLEAMLEKSSGTTTTLERQLFARMLSLDYEERYGELSGTPDQIKVQTLDALISQLLRIASVSPVLFLLEDAQWIDPTTLALIEASMQHIQDHRILVVITHRPEWNPTYSGVTTLQLNRLGKTKSAELVRKVVGDFPSDQVIERITKRSDGIPLFIEELAKSIVEHSLEVDSAEIPETLQASLLARIDRLDIGSRELAQTASSIGREFDREIILKASDHNEAAVDEELKRLLQAELILKTGTISSNRFLFKHALIQEAVYDTMLSQARKQQHSKIADALASTLEYSSATSSETLARHYYEAERIGEAVECWHQAGLNYASQSANTEAVAQIYRAINALSSVPDDQITDTGLMLKLYIDSTGPMVASSGFTSQKTAVHVEKSLYLAKRIGDTTEIFPILYGRYIAHALGGKVTEAINYAEEFLALAKSENKAELIILGHRISGQARFFTAETDSALNHLLTSVDIKVPDSEIYAPFHFGHDIQTAPMCYLSWIHSYLDNTDEVLRWTDKAEERANSTGHANTIGYVLIHNAYAYAWSGMFEKLESTISKWKIFDEEKEVPAWRPFFDVAECLLQFKEADDSSTLERKFQICETNNIAKGLMFVIPDMKAKRAQLLTRMGQFDDARLSIKEGLKLTENGERFQLPELLLASAILDESIGVVKEDVKISYQKALSVAIEFGAKTYAKQIQKQMDRFSSK